MTTTPPSAPTGGSWRMARLTAPMARAVAGRRFFPLWAVVHHRGRRTGRELSVPVAVRPVGGGLLIALPWGAGTNWPATCSPPAAAWCAGGGRTTG